MANGGPSPCGGARRGPRRAPGRLFPPSTGDPGVWSHSRAPRRGAPHRRRWTSGRLLTMGDGPLARPVKASAPAFSITAVSKNIVPTCYFLNGARVAACILNGARVAACILNGARVAACDPSALLQCERGATTALFDPLDPMGQKVLPSPGRGSFNQLNDRLPEQRDGVVVIPALIRVPDGIASGEAAAGVRPEAVSRRVVPCLAPRVQRHSPLDDLFQTDSMPRLSASPLLWHAEAMTTKRSKRSIYLTDKLANSQ